MSVGEHEFTLNNRKVNYYEAGLHHGHAVLLLHGGIGDAKQNWYDVIPQLAEDYHVLAPDLPGFGGSEKLSGSRSLSDIAAWLIDFLKSQDVEQVAVIGNGFGALIARFMAAQYPQNVVAVILINGGYIPDVPLLAKILVRLPLVGGVFSRMIANIATSADSLNDIIYHPEVVTPELIANAKANASGFAKLMQMTASKPLPFQNKPIVAILIIWGVADKFMSLSEGYKLKNALAGADFIEIKECGHLPHLEEPDIFDWQVKQFLTKHNAMKRGAIPGT
jgi:2-hydroxy-6-oxonona-2,4-dienedioate hydrolase